MSTTIESKEIERYTIAVSHDDDCESPREWGNIGRLLADVRGGAMGDGSLRAFLQSSDYDGDECNINEICAYLNQSGYAVPVSMTDHSGREVYRGSPGDAWDAGYIGVYYVENRDGMTDGELNTLIDSELDLYTDWLNGECYGYTVTKTTEINGWVKTEEIDSRCGFIGYDECVQSARCAVPSGAEVEVID